MSFIKNVPMQDLIAAPENPFKVTMDSEMERRIEAGEVSTVIVKDYCAIIGLNQKDLENQGILA